ncbi:DEAD/DEAH box helicase [Ancylostoma caninum]|uniref:DEAD/DEAH box helicase n=1 Tax=Ancylostoma caninum TaxID=29170 RepID=A0A368H878_ANCCA|nr:DEAD/DEAH box helicase [Ancylostoma caninum]
MCRTIEGAIECRKKDERFQDCKEIVDLHKKPPNAPNYTGEQLNDFSITLFSSPTTFHRQYKQDEKKPCSSVLVLTPTRELAQQIQREVKKYSYNGYKSVCSYGGVARRDQMGKCRSGVEIVIATPGKLADLAEEGVISLATVSCLALDEADRMLGLGFEPSIRRILYEIRPDRIVALTSATWPENVRKLAKKYTKDAVMVVVGSLNLTACTAVKQYFEFWEESQKFHRLREIVHFLRCIHGPRFMMIIFMKAKAMVDFISAELCRYGFAAQGIHGGRSQLDRDNVFREPAHK